MAQVIETIDVEVPVRTAYNQWTQFESLPQFMEGVEQIEQLDDTHLRWKAKVAGRTKEWRAEITEQRPDERVAWRSEDGADNAGVVTFHKLGEGQSRITVQIDAEPEGPIESVGEALGLLERRVKGRNVRRDLQRFKGFIEGRGDETGAWRGEVEQDPAT
jgi:uncharacterized membrane protein